jgi:hypothetical protein
MLSFHVKRERDVDTIEIFCNAVGMPILLRNLAACVGERATHRHLFCRTDDGELNETTPFGDEAVYEVIINYAEGD